MIILRETIADGTGHFPKGTIATWPEDRELPPGMVWLRTRVGPHGQVVTNGDFTPEAKRIIDEVLHETVEMRRVRLRLQRDLARQQRLPAL